MTDSKSWLWRKKSSDKTVIVTEKEDLALKQHEEQIQAHLAEKAKLERDIHELDGKLSSALSECTVKDNLVEKHSKTAKEALAGWEKAEAKALALKEELDEAVKRREICEERTHHMDSALKECMQQLRFVREDQEQRIHDVQLKASEELEETRMFFEEKLEEAGEKIANLTAENAQLGNMLLLKEQFLEDLHQQMAKAEADMSALLGRLEHAQKENNSLKYEVRLLEKEVDIRNEEREFNRRSTDAAHKHHLENVKKIAKLESECQRLRVLVRKRLPGPAALAKMKSEVGILQRESADSRRRNSHPQLDYTTVSYPESPGKKFNLMTERICALEDENRLLQETLQKHLNELQVSRNMYVQTATKLSQVEAQLEELPRNHLIRDIRSSRISRDLSLASMSDVGSDDKVSCTGSCASASVLERHKLASPSKSVGMSDINEFMDDFAEMEKLALVCVDKPVENSPSSEGKGDLISFTGTTGKDLVPISTLVDSVAGANYKSSLSSRLSNSISKLIEIVEGVNLPSEDNDPSQTPRDEKEHKFSPSNSETSKSYLVRSFQWRASELAAVLQQFLRTSDDLLNGKADVETFVEEVTTAVEWIMDHCFSLQDVSIMKDTVKRQLRFDETRTESETEAGLFRQLSEADKLTLLKDKLASAKMNVANSELHCDMTEDGKDVKDEVKCMDLMKHESNDHSTAHDTGSLRNKLEDPESTIVSLRGELEALKQLNAVLEDQFENNAMMIEDLNVQLVAVRSEISVAYHKLAALEGELKSKAKQCEELEAKCLEFQVQLESATKADASQHTDHDKKQLGTEREISAASEKLAECQETILYLGQQLKAMSASREAEVSDKFISTPTNTNTNAANVASTTNVQKLTSQRASLLDQMQADDYTTDDQIESPETKEIISAKNVIPDSSKDYITRNGSKKSHSDIALGSLAIVPIRKQQTPSRGLLKKLLWRKKKNSSRRMQLPFEA